MVYTAAGSGDVKMKCGICGRTNHPTKKCRFKGQSKCDICDWFGHKEADCYSNPANHGKGRENRRDMGKRNPVLNRDKGKGRANVALDSDSDNDAEKLGERFEANVTIVDTSDSEMSTAVKASLSAYSWIADSGATIHVCAQRDAFATYEPLTGRTVKGLGNKSVSAIGQGIVILRSKNNGEVTEITCHKTLHVPEAHENLFSLARFRSGGGHLTLVDGPMILSDPIGNQLMTASKKNGLFYLNASTVIHDTANVTVKVKWRSGTAA